MHFGINLGCGAAKSYSLLWSATLAQNQQLHARLITILFSDHTLLWIRKFLKNPRGKSCRATWTCRRGHRPSSSWSELVILLLVVIWKADFSWKLWFTKEPCHRTSSWLQPNRSRRSAHQQNRSQKRIQKVSTYSPSLPSTSGFFFGRFGGKVGEWNFRKIEFWQISWVLTRKIVEFLANLLEFWKKFLEFW